MRDWHSIQFETQHRMATRTHDAALGHRGDGAWLLAIRRVWRALVARSAAASARPRVEDRPARIYEGGRA